MTSNEAHGHFNIPPVHMRALLNFAATATDSRTSKPEEFLNALPETWQAGWRYH
jgi:hypothetical protein